MTRQLPLEECALATAADPAAPGESERLLDLASGTGGSSPRRGWVAPTPRINDTTPDAGAA
jgi:hypothetical protein